LVRKIFTFYINDVLLFKCPIPGPKGYWRDIPQYIIFISADMRNSNLAQRTFYVNQQRIANRSILKPTRRDVIIVHCSGPNRTHRSVQHKITC